MISPNEKLEFPLMNKRKFIDTLESIERSKIWEFDEVREEVKIAKLHYELELKLA